MTPKQAQQKQSILAQCVDVLRLKHMALTTEKTYLAHIGSYINIPLL